MKPSVYIETTVVSYLTARASRDVLRLAHQQLTREWWDAKRPSFETFTSQLVIAEASLGDPQAAAERLAVLGSIPLVAVTEQAEGLADWLVADGAIPAKARLDALHLAVSATNGMDFLLTWNCRHLANATLRKKIEAACRAAGYEPPIIGTVLELHEVRP